MLAPISTSTISLAARRIARVAADAHRSCPVEVVTGDVAPTVRGESFYWTTLSGKTRIQHPGAYGWPMAYHASSLRVQVGVQWLLDHSDSVDALVG